MCHLSYLVGFIIVVNVWKVAFSKRYFEAGGVGKLLSKQKRTIYVNEGEEARIQWKFSVDKTIAFQGVRWYFFDGGIHSGRQRWLIWMDKAERPYQYSTVRDRIEYKVHLASDEPATLVIPNVQLVHTNKYICHVPRSGHVKDIYSEVTLIVTEAPQDVKITSSNGDISSVEEASNVTFTCSAGEQIEPTPHVAWWKSGIQISPKQRQTSSFTKIFSKKDDGTYECIANNLTRTINITVKSRGERPTTLSSWWNITYTAENKPSITSLDTHHALNEETVVTEPITVASTQKSHTKGLKTQRKSGASTDSQQQKLAIYLFSGSSALFITFILILGIKKFRNCTRKKRSIPQSPNRTNSTQLEEMSNSDVHQSQTSGQITDGSWSTDWYSARSGFSYRDSSEEDDASEYSAFVLTVGESFTAPMQTFGMQPFSNTATVQQNADAPAVPLRRVYEIERGLIRNLEKIGEGAFGLVARADLFNSTTGAEKCTVAVKMLKAIASPEDRKDLISEFNLMRRIDSHPNVVKLIGCVMRTEPILVVTEYVPHGDLLGFLRKSRGIIDTTYINIGCIPTTNLTQKQLLRMARDVARGMTHLSRYQVIHRDLAARNVLVGRNIECKITDFGMARDVKSTDYYRRKSRGRIPLKWTAIEAIVDEKYTVASDIWSFGILFYEIVTIGGQPYPGMGARELVQKLKTGWRMSKPAHVDVELYKIMQQCWKHRPDDRPTFSVLARKFNKLYGGDSEYINMDDYDNKLYRNDEDTPEHSSSPPNEIEV